MITSTGNNDEGFDVIIDDETITIGKNLIKEEQKNKKEKEMKKKDKTILKYVAIVFALLVLGYFLFNNY